MRSNRNCINVQEEDIQLLGEDVLRRRKRRMLSRTKLVTVTCFTVLLLIVIILVVVPCVFVLLWAPREASLPILPSPNCSSGCKLSLVETIPENLTFSSGQGHLSTYAAWMQLLRSARTNVTISSFYWTLRGTENINDPTDNLGSDIFNALNETGSRGVTIRVVKGPDSDTFPNHDAKVLSSIGAIQLRSLNLTKLLGSGIIHTKMWITDNQHFYVGSANMDWRSLTQVKELGILGMNCSCLANDAQKMFEVYWELSANTTAKVPSEWPSSLAASFSLDNPANLNVNGTPAKVYFGTSPPELKTKNRTDDIVALLNVIKSAKNFIYIAVMDYVPAIVYTKPKKYWSVIDDALKAAAYDKGVDVRLLGSYWKHTPYDMITSMKSLGSLKGGFGPLNGTIETRLFEVPPVKNKTIPFTRVNHNKYMVTDNAAYIGTSNWSGDYFVDTCGVSINVNQTGSSKGDSTIQNQLKQIFERDWSSSYSKDNINDFNV